MKMRTILPAVLLLTLCACRSLYYGTMEKMGFPKREILVDRVEEARDSQNQAKYRDLMGAMRKAEARLEPALSPLRDQVLFMKHNLNAKAIAGLSTEVGDVQANVEQLVREMETAIAQADSFIEDLKKE
ncbi:MAG: DUF2959 family protein [Kiritimatiellia bacterium]